MSDIASLLGYLPIDVKLLREDAKGPARGSELASGWDVCAYADPTLLPESLQHQCTCYVRNNDKGIVLRPDVVTMIPLGFAIGLPPGWEAQLRPRSGISIRNSLVLVPTTGTIDPDFRGCVTASYLNLGPEPVYIAHGDRVAQLIYAPIPRVTHRIVAELSATARGEGGWGSTGR